MFLSTTRGDVALSVVQVAPVVQVLWLGLIIQLGGEMVRFPDILGGFPTPTVTEAGCELPALLLQVIV